MLQENHSSLHIYNGAMKKNEIIPFAVTWMNTEILILNKVRKRKTSTVCYQFYAESKIWHKWTHRWNRNTLTYTDNKLVVAKGEEDGRGMDWEFGARRCKLLHIAWINNKVLLYSTGKWITVYYPVINHNGKEHEKECIHVYTHTHTHTYICITEWLCCTVEINTAL